MKNSKKKIIFLIGLIVIICLIIGYTLHINKKENYVETQKKRIDLFFNCLLYTSPSPRDRTRSRMPSSA